MKQFTIGVDFGTDSARAVLADASDGSVLASAARNYPRWADGLYCDAAVQQFRQHPLDYIECLEGVLKEVVGACPDPSAIRAIAVDTTGSTVCMADADGMPLSLQSGFEGDPDAMFILWKDHTATVEAAEFTSAGAKYEPNYICQSGNHYSSECTWAKVLHTVRKSEKVRRSATGFIDECDFVTALLTGARGYASMKWGHCIPAAKQLWNKDWGGYPPEWFFESIDPILIPYLRAVPHDNYASSRKAGTLCHEWAAKLGLGTGVVIGVGNCDAHSGAVGAGVRPGTAVLNLGTSACYMAVMPVEEMKGHFIDGLFGQAEGTILEGYMGYETGLSAFGDIFAWFRRLTGRPLDELGKEAEAIALRDDLPLATDFFNGRRAPNPSNTVTAGISGLRITTGPAEIYRALVEAAAFGSRACIDQYLDGGIRIDRMIAVGGIALKSPFVVQTLCDVLGRPVEVSGCSDACALGSAIHAAVAAGLYGSVLEAEDAMCPGSCAVYTPDASRREFYQHRYEKYGRLAAWELF